MKRAGEYWVPDSETQQIAALEAGGWQLDHLDAALKHVRTFGLAIDGGAHVGTWTNVMARRFQIVHAFEPCEETFDCLARNIESACAGTGCDVHLHQIALGADFASAGMAEDGKYSNGGNTGGRYLDGMGTITVVPLDGFLKDLLRLDFLKLDLEGYEPFAISGAAETIRRFRPVVMIEDKHRMAFRFGYHPGEGARRLQTLGMTELDRVGADRIFGWA